MKTQNTLAALGIRFFEPDQQMIEWLRGYLGNRIPLDVGCGQGDLLMELNKGGLGIDPFFDGARSEFAMKHIHILPMTVQECGKFITGLGKKAVMIIARPCHSNFIEDAIDMAPKGMEILYITKPENIIDYCDLGKYDDQKVLVQHEGQGAENEVVYSIIKK